MEYENKLTPLHWQLYNFIKERTLAHISTSVGDVCAYLPNDFFLNAKPSNYSNCPTLYQAIDYINASPEIEKIIIKDNNNFRLATEEEAKAYAEKIFNQCLRRFKKYWNIQRKIDKDGQGKLLSTRLREIDEYSEARPFTEAFVKNENL